LKKDNAHTYKAIENSRVHGIRYTVRIFSISNLRIELIPG
jgi:hypothetical protein